MPQYTDFDRAYYECRQEAINAGALRPQGFKERFAAGICE